MPLPSESQARPVFDLDDAAAALGLAIPEILLPKQDVDLERWAVVACDQFTSEPDYWRKVEETVGPAPSTLRMVLPESRLEDLAQPDLEMQIASIERSMEETLATGVLESIGRCWVLVDRRTSQHASRWGLVLAVDLERYEYEPGRSGLVRATEGTVLSRIPPRLRIRRNAPLELPHVQLLFDDPGRTVFGPLVEAARSGALPSLYDTDLMMGGGHVRGFRVDGRSRELRETVGAFARLPGPKRDGFLLLVGDGNHSLAAAKVHWEAVRASLPEGVDTTGSPARYALVEGIDLHDPGLEFEPIHRLVYGAAPDEIRDYALSCCSDLGTRSRVFDTASQAVRFARGCDPAMHPVPIVSRGTGCVLFFERPRTSLAVATIQEVLDGFSRTRSCRLDYIHGEETLLRLSETEGSGLLLPALAKSALFPLIAEEGVLPRKAFSMGEATEKRYYMEARRIR